MKLIIKKNYDEMSKEAAKLLAAQIGAKPNSILGLATGSTPEGMYEYLAEDVKEGKISFKDVRSFNLDEYVGIPEDHPLSYHTYMKENLFAKVDINIANTRVPSGLGDVNANGQQYDKDIAAAGGVDLQILGIGQNAHIAFNEPGSSFTSGTREVKLTESTIAANARYFVSKDEVPKTAISMGLGTLMKANKIIMMASGVEKAQAIKDTMEAPEVTEAIPSTLLRNHNDVTIIVDESAASLLSK